MAPGAPIPELFAQRGEGEFRALEEQVALEFLDRAQPGTPVALGGGTLGSERVRRALEDHVVAYLEIDEDTAWARATADGITRPLAADRERFATLLRERQPVYQAAADAFLSQDAIPAPPATPCEGCARGRSCCGARTPSSSATKHGPRRATATTSSPTSTSSGCTADASGRCAAT